MPLNISEFLNGIAISAGIDQDDPALKLILADGNLTKIEVPAAFESLVSNKYKDMVTLEAAKNHPELKKHFTATLLHGVEKDIDRFTKEIWELSDEDRAELKKAEGAQKRMEMAFKLGKERLEKKAPATDNEKVKKLETQISQLNADLLAKDESFENEKKTLKQGFLDKRKDHAFKELFQSYQYTDALPKSVQEQTARAIILAKLQQDNNKVVFKEEDDSLQLFTNEDTAVYQNNKPVNLKQYVESVLAENKLLQVTPIKPLGDEKKREPLLVVNPPANTKGDTSSFQRELEASLQDLGRPAA